MPQEIRYEVRDKIGILTVDRPQARNALNWAAQEQFAALVRQIGQEQKLRVLIITGSGEQAFVSGGDLKELSRESGPEDGERLSRVMGSALIELTKLPVIVIAAVNGDAIGGGCEILTASDLRLATTYARFRFAEVSVGLSTGWGGGARLIRLIGQSRATELLLTGREFSAEEAYFLGLIHRVTPVGQNVFEAALNWAEELVRLPAIALTTMKEVLWSSLSYPLPAAYELEQRLFNELWQTPDHLEALRAFTEKRKPTFGNV